ncbi:uncharacterized protein METZ01_LOCUS274789, partial [marine metagenome]
RQGGRHAAECGILLDKPAPSPE